MPDSTIDGLPLLTAPDGADQIPTLDVSAGGIVNGCLWIKHWNTY
jgi:hypothetical protein